jgi:pyruvate formate lyase activating enzyme
MVGTVFEIREFCLQDGPGVRTTVFLKGCPLRCAWCHNPEGLSPQPQLLFKPANCRHCGMCRKVCPHPGACQACGACVKVCPEGCRQICGQTWTPEALAAELRRNADFFAAQGGGITFSGGEPLLQAAFVAETAKALHPIPLAIETSGFAAPADYQAVVNEMDFVFQDLKHPDPALHRRWTGVDPAPIHANLRWLKASGRPFVARIPLIPGVNDSAESLEGFARLLEGPSGLLRVELLPYHLTAGAKYPFVGKSYDPGFDEHRPLNRDLSAFASRGLQAALL